MSNMLEVLKVLNLSVRFLLELCVLFILGYWGYKIGGTTSFKIILAIIVPLTIAIVWGVFGSPHAPIKLSVLVHAAVEFCIFFLPFLALYTLNYSSVAILYATFVVANRLLMFIWGQ
ncbi:hypothetical protein HNQ94_002251 [Salirhabdus euzebyi]|uniref:DUF2568 domain-containing protein n=1 Tax=Salirhabdus euzebyi TaxID=394506 RepID=A0A841Q5W6_9BACI|nr:YrdB family protein [Salirhabdus euzebyi]MBB6453800.1 hypothetical protein [Salirhabdus euzebyi]